MLKGIEVDILEDGSLDLPDHVLAKLDLVLGAVHSKFELSRARQPERILRAMQHPNFTMLAHPGGAHSAASPCDIDMLALVVKRAAAAVFLSSNATRSASICWTFTARWRRGRRAGQHQLRCAQYFRLRQPALRQSGRRGAVAGKANVLNNPAPSLNFKYSLVEPCGGPQGRGRPREK